MAKDTFNNKFGRPLAPNQLIQKKLTDMQTEPPLLILGRAITGMQVFN